MYKNLVYSVFTKATVALVNFCILVLSSRYLGVNSRGEISIFILNITVIQILNEVYTGYSLIYFVPKFNLKKIITAGIVYTVIFCSLSNLIIVFLDKQVPGYEWLGYIISILVILNTFHCVLILGKENLRMYNLLSFLQPFILLLGVSFFVFVLKKYTFESYIYPLLVSFTCAIFFSGAIVFKYIFMETKVASEFVLKPVLARGLAYQATILMFMFANRYSYYLLPGSGSVGLYSSACTLMESVLLIVNSITPLLLSRVVNTGNTLESVKMTIRLSKISFILSCVAVVIINLLPESLFTQILGIGFSGIKTIMLQYTPVILMMSLLAILSTHLSAIGKQNLVLACYGAGFLFSLLFAPVLIRFYGVGGASLNANITYFIMTIAIYSVFIRLNKIPLSSLIYDSI